MVFREGAGSGCSGIEEGRLAGTLEGSWPLEPLCLFPGADELVWRPWAGFTSLSLSFFDLDTF